MPPSTNGNNIAPNAIGSAGTLGRAIGRVVTTRTADVSAGTDPGFAYHETTLSGRGSLGAAIGAMQATREATADGNWTTYATRYMESQQNVLNEGYQQRQAATHPYDRFLGEEYITPFGSVGVVPTPARPLRGYTVEMTEYGVLRNLQSNGSIPKRKERASVHLVDSRKVGSFWNGIIGS